MSNSQSPVAPYRLPDKTARLDVMPQAFSPAAAILFCLLHIPLALLSRANELVATGYALFALGFGLLWALSTRTLARFTYLAAYIAGAEVVWRMTSANVFWEYGKYAVALVFLVGIFTIKKPRTRFDVLPIAYFALLLPSIFLTVSALSLNQAREEISFNLSGPFAMMVCVLFFNGQKINRTQLGNMVITWIAPVVGMAALIIDNIRRAGFNITFTDASNMVTSGGYGPNQVSAILGLAFLFLVVFLLLVPSSRGLKGFAFLLLVVFATQSILTFSRGGIYLGSASAIVVAVLSTRNAQSRVRAAAISVLLFSIAYFWIFPFVNGFTGGSALERYKDMNLTSRDQLMRQDIALFQENPLLGVGPGMAIYSRTGNLAMVAAHTEFTRVLAEHGAFGIASTLLLLLIGLVAFFRAKNTITHALVAGFFVWALLFMAVNGMRIVAPSLVIGLACVNWLDEIQQPLPPRRSYYGFGEWKKPS